MVIPQGASVINQASGQVEKQPNCVVSMEDEKLFLKSACGDGQSNFPVSFFFFLISQEKYPKL